MLPDGSSLASPLTLEDQKLIPNQNGLRWVVKYADKCQDCISDELCVNYNYHQLARNSQLENQQLPHQGEPDTRLTRSLMSHWRTWFTQADVQRLKKLGINTVRVPVRLLFLEQFRVSILTVRRSLATGSSNPSWKRENTIPRVECVALYVYIPLRYRWLLHPLQKEGLQWLREAGIAVILDHHALPGVSSENQMFAGQ
jgi:hypothetical protein